MRTLPLVLCGLLLSGLNLLIFQPIAHASSRILPFQGWLTDARGNAISDGPRVVQFKLYDAPVGGSAVWNGEVQKLTVKEGLVSTLLGTKASLARVDFNHDLYLELTVDANNDGQITAADPPLLPRQSLVPVAFAQEAANSRKLDGYDWADVFAQGSEHPPTALLAGNRLVPASVKAEQIAPQTITAAQIVPGSVTSDRIARNSLTTNELATALLDLLVPTGTIAAFGGETAPSGWLVCDGSVLQRTNYPRLFSAIALKWTCPNCALSQDVFQIPDLRGLFLRGVNGTSDRDPDWNLRRPTGDGEPGTVGSIQEDKMRQHIHGFLTTASARTFANLPDDIDPRFLTLNANAGGSEVKKGFDGGVLPSGGSETRPVNAYVNYIIKY